VLTRVDTSATSSRSVRDNPGNYSEKREKIQKSSFGEQLLVKMAGGVALFFTFRPVVSIALFSVRRGHSISKIAFTATVKSTSAFGRRTLGRVWFTGDGESLANSIGAIYTECSVREISLTFDANA